MSDVEKLKRELRELQKKRSEEIQIKNLKKQIKAEKFAQTKGGKVFNKIADVGDAGWKATKKFLSPQEVKKGNKKNVKSVNEVMKDIDKAINMY